MSGVTIGELVEDFIPHTEKGNKITQVEIVPRKIVEKIIEFCREGENKAGVTYMTTCFENERKRASGSSSAYVSIRAYAEGLLENFESEGEDDD